MPRRSNYGWVIVGIAAGAMVATLPARTVGLGLITEPLLDELAPAPIEVPPPPPPPPPWFRRPWALAAMGGAALTVVSVTTILLLSGDSDMRQTGGLCFPPDC